jgi:translation initiation factor 4E
VGLTGVFVL